MRVTPAGTGFQVQLYDNRDCAGSVDVTWKLPLGECSEVAP